ncbi:MAG: glucosyl-3-phosphoglycerate synthase [Jatrophihabitans sp.]|uniref:glucosyl-3-phosphoglycerate synthase n=1 Tax=Jatrophihabitans sp. TaxID=1932789 RepID=UPI003F7F0B12
MTDPVAWFAAATTVAADWPVERVAAAKGDHRIAVVLPARNEEATVGDIVAAIRADLMTTTPLVDELIVIDSDSTDATAERAVAAGAVVHPARGIRPDLGTNRGKGEALWKSQFVTSADLLVFVDADLTGWGTHFVTGLLGPLLTDPRVQLVKGFYDRILDDGSGAHAPQGGRVTELVARPLLAQCRPALSRVVQPLAGEWAIRRSAFARLSVPVGYGVEMATLLDIHERFGLTGIAQVDLGARAHAHQSVHDLGVMASEIVAVTLARTLADAPPAAPDLWQFDRRRPESWHARQVPVVERPPAAPLLDNGDR